MSSAANPADCTESRRVGSCLCGQIAYEVTGDPHFCGLCHCVNCQKWTGTGTSWVALFLRHVSNLRFIGHVNLSSPECQIDHLLFNNQQVRFIKGEDLLKTYEDKATTRGKIVYRRFCPDCGSSLVIAKAHNPDIFFVPCGVVDGDVSDVWKPTMEVFCKDRPKWMPDVPGNVCCETVPESQKH